MCGLVLGLPTFPSTSHQGCGGREEQWGGEGPLYGLLPVSHGKCCRPYSASGWLQPLLGAFASCLHGAVWDLGTVLEVDPPPLGNLLRDSPTPLWLLEVYPSVPVSRLGILSGGPGTISLIPVELAPESRAGSWPQGWFRGVAMPPSPTHAEAPSWGYSAWVLAPGWQASHCSLPRLAGMWAEGPHKALSTCPTLSLEASFFPLLPGTTALGIQSTHLAQVSL